MESMTITLVAIAVTSVVVPVLLALWLVRRRRASASSGRDDRYSPERILTPEQTHMLDYLQDTFPGQIVLPNMSLSRLLTVRRAADRQRAANRLKDYRVDFVVCGQDGRPSFAFDVEQYHLSDAKAKAHKAVMKNRILKTAGVRFVFLKNGIHRMPSPADFRAQLNLAELPKPKAKEEARESALQQLESQFSSFDSLHSSHNNGYRDSEVMGMSRLMDLDEFGQRRSGASGSRTRASSGGSFDDSRSHRNSRFDGSSLDVRGG
ncbi:DUF2726 domain-containing protein [Hydrogenophaga sp. BPS33]|uniref:DUF2726 domain-containing protein n=1 Tax=Hydrogenophaga sp. BPS33 TaxID=2651974 RepID=UPI00131FE3B4|nr:DUF2726 domain-containing protein [Hydrogenophaga sp. BPS33]QHE84252.1 DUF2726 domain-containing protein [Hydrogenophaga sp. BPS33]